jgi:hypothetical protein
MMEGRQQYQGCHAVVGAMAVVAAAARQWQPNNQLKKVAAAVVAATIPPGKQHRQWESLMGRRGGTTTGTHSPCTTMVKTGKKPGSRHTQKRVQAHANNDMDYFVSKRGLPSHIGFRKSSVEHSARRICD